MPPKPTRATKMQNARRRGSVAEASKQLAALQNEQKQLQENLRRVAKQKAKAAKAAARLKKKAMQTNVGDMLQIMMMKAFQLKEDDRIAKGGDASSSTDVWYPRSATEAWTTIEAAVGDPANEVSKFAAMLRGTEASSSDE